MRQFFRLGTIAFVSWAATYAALDYYDWVNNHGSRIAYVYHMVIKEKRPFMDVINEKGWRKFRVVYGGHFTSRLGRESIFTPIKRIDLN